MSAPNRTLFISLILLRVTMLSHNQALSVPRCSQAQRGRSLTNLRHLRSLCPSFAEPNTKLWDSESFYLIVYYLYHNVYYILYMFSRSCLYVVADPRRGTKFFPFTLNIISWSSHKGGRFLKRIISYILQSTLTQIVFAQVRCFIWHMKTYPFRCTRQQWI